jgi:purine-binding chemotaxis protein CheW
MTYTTQETTINPNSSNISNHLNQYVLFKLNNELFSMNVENVKDILLPHQIIPIPLSSSEIVGCINLRGRIVTTIDLKQKIDLQSDQNFAKSMIIVVENNDYLYGFLVDSVVCVLHLNENDISPSPGNFSQKWDQVSTGIFNYNQQIVVILDNDILLRDYNNIEEHGIAAND